MLRAWAVIAMCCAVACGEPATPSEPAGAEANADAGAPGEVSVELGVPGGDDGLGFVPLRDGDELRLQTFGQGGTHVMVAVRTSGFGNRAFVSATLRSLATDITVSEPPPARPQLLYCGMEGGVVCDLVPYLVHTSGLAPTNDEKDGLHVALTARVQSDSGEAAEGSCEVVLSTRDL